MALSKSQRNGAWIAVASAWVIAGASLASPPSARINGVQVGAALLVAVLFGALRLRRREREKADTLEWLALATVVLLVGTLDYSGVRAQGIAINVAPVVVAILAALRGRRRT